ncbi:MAG: hypothetical protein IJ899_00495 [Blautia sp.]|nr:hypothetical protein [Blautia sp.]
MKDLTKLPTIQLTSEEQKEFERRAHVVDDNNNPPIIRDRPDRHIEITEKKS